MVLTYDKMPYNPFVSPYPYNDTLFLLSLNLRVPCKSNGYLAPYQPYRITYRITYRIMRASMRLFYLSDLQGCTKLDNNGYRHTLYLLIKKRPCRAYPKAITIDKAENRHIRIKKIPIVVGSISH